MTAIAYRDGVLAADTMTTAGHYIEGHTTKIWRRCDGALAGASGRAEHGHEFRRRFLEAGLDDWKIADRPGDDGGFSGIVIEPDGTVVEYSEIGPSKIDNQPFHALGSAFYFLMGAMAHGAGAEEAVRLATAHITTCGPPIMVLYLHDRGA